MISTKLTDLEFNKFKTGMGPMVISHYDFRKPIKQYGNFVQVKMKFKEKTALERIITQYAHKNKGSHKGEKSKTSEYYGKR